MILMNMGKMANNNTIIGAFVIAVGIIFLFIMTSGPKINTTPTNENGTAVLVQSGDTINGFFPELSLRDVLFQSGLLFTLPSQGTLYAGNEVLDNIVCTNNVSLLLTNFELKSTGESFTFNIYENPNVSSLGFEIANPFINVNRQSNITSNLTLYLLPTILDDGLLIFGDIGLGTKQTPAKTSEFFQDFLFKLDTCYNIEVTNNDNQAHTLYSQFELGEIPLNLSSPIYGTTIRGFLGQ